MKNEDKTRIFRERFYGKQDTVGRRWTSTRPDGSQVSGYAPICSNLWADFCHLKLKDGVRCGNCEHKKLTPMNDNIALKHIKGEEHMLCYLVQEDGTVKFSAFDFDCKEGKPHLAYYFEDVMKVSNLLKEWGIDHGIARSTGRGYHLYIFYDDFYPANKFRAIVLEIYEQVGFLEYLRQGIKPVPEFFPKQSYVAQDGLGNGIKPPMIEANFEKGRNCFVDENDRPIGEGLPLEEMINAQWNYLASIPRVPAAKMDAIIERFAIEVTEDSRPAGGRPQGSLRGGKGQAAWQPPLNGSIEKVLEGCAALRRIKERVLKGEVLGHHDGFALFHMCKSTLDGVDWFKANVKGWGETESQLKQLQHSIEKNYSPWTCRKLQENGVCPVNTRCFERRPPREIVDGREVIRDDLPKDQWPEPSPVRYAFGKGEDFLLKLQAEATALTDVEDNELRLEGLRDMAVRAQVFDEEQQKAFKEHVKELKVVRRNDLAKIFVSASVKHQEKVNEKTKERTDTIWVDDNCYVKLDYGYALVKKARGGETRTVQLCSVDINLTEERRYLDESRTTFAGIVRTRASEYSFEISACDWTDNNKFLRYFTNRLGAEFTPLRANVETIKQAAQAFYGLNPKVVEVTATPGFRNGQFLMPSVGVSAKGINSDPSPRVDLSNRPFLHRFDFSVVDDREFQRLMRHIFDDFLHAWPDQWTYPGLAFALTPPLAAILKCPTRPTLFYEGLTGTGKTELLKALQQFWGDFPALSNLLSTSKSITELSYLAKDLAIGFDDFKAINVQQVAAIRESIQYGFDGSERGRLDKEANLTAGRPCRAFKMMTGEDFPGGEASIIARTLLVEVESWDKRLGNPFYERVQAEMSKYKAITPRFIHFILNRDISNVADVYSKTAKLFQDKFVGKINNERIATTYAFNFTVWREFVALAVAVGSINSIQHEELIKRHAEILMALAKRQIDRCQGEHSGVFYANLLRELLESGQVYIEGLDNGIQGSARALKIGKIHPDGTSAYVYPNLVSSIFGDYARRLGNPLPTVNAISRHFRAGGLLKSSETGRGTIKVNRGDIPYDRVWHLDLARLGVRSLSGQLGEKTSVVRLARRMDDESML